MNCDNADFISDNIACGHCGIALFARPVGDVLQGAAADCNSAVKIANSPSKINNMMTLPGCDNSGGQSKNIS